MNCSQEKKNKIKESLKLTRLKRQSQRCKTVELKIDESRLNLKEKTQLKMFFVEAKWIYNFVLSENNPFKHDYKTPVVTIKNKDGNLVNKTLQYLPAYNKQTIIKILRQSIMTLSKKKKLGLKVGRLKFKSEYNSIPLNYYGTTHKIIKNKLRINGIKRHLKVFGLEQIKDSYEFANAKLLKKPSGYYIKLVCFEFIKPKQLTRSNYKEVGLDFGIKNNITTSEGEVFNLSIEESERLKRLQQKFARQVKGSNNRYKTRLLIQKEYEKLTNKKNDAANKLVNKLLTENYKVYMQDENLSGWQKGDFGKEVQNSYMGRVKSKLKRSPNVTVIDKYFPSTQLCYNCGTMNNISLKERTYTCSNCNHVEDRDIKAAKTIMHVGKCLINYVPTERREVKPKENLTSGDLPISANI